MFRRVTWFMAGAVAGASGSMYARRKAREAAQRYRPAAIARNTAGRVRSRATDVVDAVRDGRAAMKEREAELRAAFDEGLVVDDETVDLEIEDVIEPTRRGRAGPRRRARR